MTPFQGLLCDSARKPLLTCTALLWRKMVPRFLLFQGSNRHSSAALFIKHKLLKTACSLVLMSTQAIFITAAWSDEKTLFRLPPWVSLFSPLAYCACLTWSKKWRSCYCWPQRKSDFKWPKYHFLHYSELLQYSGKYYTYLFYFIFFIQRWIRRLIPLSCLYI